MFENYFNKTVLSQRRSLYNKLPYFVALLYIPAIYFAIFPGKIIIVSFICFGLISFFYFTNIKGLNIRDYDGEKAFVILLIYNLITFIRGFFNVDVKSDLYILFSNDLFVYFLIPFLIFLADFDILKRLWRLFCTFGLLLCIVCYFLPPGDETMSFGHNVSFLTGIILCSPFIDRKYFIYFIIIAFFSVTYDLDRRSVTVGFLVSILLVLFYKFLIKLFVRRIIYALTILIPVALLLLGSLGKFNVFKFIETINLDVELSSNRQYTVDSRTSIYMDVFGELFSQNKLVYGLGARGKTKTSLVQNPNHDYWRIYRHGRSQTESGMLNFFQYGGIIGFLVYSFFLLTCAYKALFNSRNSFIKLLGCFICFKYLYSFIEDPLTTNVYTFSLFIWLGICLNKKFRALSNKDMTNYLNLIFPKHTLLSNN